jgi:hypothetical protein
MSQPENTIVFEANKNTGLKIGAIVLGVGAIWFLYHIKNLTAVPVVVVVIMVGATFWMATVTSKRRLAFSGETLSLISGSKTEEVVELPKVSRLVCRYVHRPRGASRTTYLAVFPDHEVELFDKQNFSDLAQIIQLLEARTGRTIEQESV